LRLLAAIDALSQRLDLLELRRTVRGAGRLAIFVAILAPLIKF